MRRERIRSFALASPAIVTIAICCGFPLLWIAFTLISHPAIVHDLHLTSFRAELLFRTLGFNGLAALIATAMGLPMGLVLGRSRGLLARLMWVIAPAALFMPSIAFAYGWAQIVRLLHLNLVPAGAADVARCIWTLAAWLWAVPACVIGLSLRRMDMSVQQQAILDGAMFRVMTRQLAGPILASLAAVTILASQEFSVYEPTGISVVATELRMVFDTGAFSSFSNPITGAMTSQGSTSPDQRQRAAAAAATALPLLLFTALLAALAAIGAGQLGASDAIAAGDWPRVLDPPKFLIAITIALLILNVVTPIVALIYSLRGSIHPILIWEEFLPELIGSLILGLIAGLLGLIVAMSAAARWARGLIAIATLSFLIGGQLLAIAMIRISNRPGLFWAYDHWPLPAAAYIGRFGWVALAAARSTWSKIWRELRDMSALDGATKFQTARAIIWPLAMPTLLAGGLLVAALSLTEVPATVLLSPQNPQPLTPMLMTWVHMARYDPMIEASLLMIALVLTPAIVAVILLSIGMRVVRR